MRGIVGVASRRPLNRLNRGVQRTQIGLAHEIPYQPGFVVFRQHLIQRKRSHDDLIPHRHPQAWLAATSLWRGRVDVLSPASSNSLSLFSLFASIALRTIIVEARRL